MAMHLKDDLESDGEMSEINVTPFIDVMLVLLIIFMVAAPLATVDVKVNLPASTSVPQPRPDKPVYLSIKADKQLYVGNNEVSKEQLVSAIDSLTSGNKEATIVCQADKDVDYATLMGVMDELRAAGYLKIGLMGLESAGSTATH